MQPNIDALVFDLDGTLWNTCGACAIAWNNVAARHEIAFRKILAQDVEKVAGLPHEECIRRTFVGLPEYQLRLLIDETQVEDNIVVADLGGELYDGVFDGLVRLASYLPLFIVSNCQSGYIEVFLDKYGLRRAFVDFECWGNTGEAKSANLARLMQRNQLGSPVLIGDTEGDAKAAFDNRIPFWHVAYGFGQVAKADRRFAGFSAIVDLFHRE